MLAFESELSQSGTTAWVGNSPGSKTRISGAWPLGARSRFSLRFISDRKVQRMRLFRSSDKHRLLVTRARSMAHSLTYVAISARRSAVALRNATWRCISAHASSTLHVKWYTQRPTESSSVGTGSLHRAMQARCSLGLPIPHTPPHFVQQGCQFSLGPGVRPMMKLSSQELCLGVRPQAPGANPPDDSKSGQPRVLVTA